MRSCKLREPPAVAQSAPPMVVTGSAARVPAEGCAIPDLPASSLGRQFDGEDNVVGVSGSIVSRGRTTRTSRSHQFALAPGIA